MGKNVDEYLAYKWDVAFHLTTASSWRLDAVWTKNIATITAQYAAQEIGWKNYRYD